MVPYTNHSREFLLKIVWMATVWKFMCICLMHHVIPLNTAHRPWKSSCLTLTS